MKTIVMFNLAETTRDPRVRRIASSLADLDNRVIVIGIKSECKTAHEKYDKFEIVRVNAPHNCKVKKMDKFSDVCPSAAEIIRKCSRQVFSEPLRISIRLKERLKDFLKKLLGFRLRMKLRRLYGGKTNQVEQCNPVFNEHSEIYRIRRTMLINLELYKSALEHNPDIVHCNDLDTLLAGFMLKENYNIPLIFDAHEIFPEQMAEHMRSHLWHGFYTELEKSLLEYTDGRITVCDSLGRYFEQYAESQEFITIRNVVSKEYLPDESVLNRQNNPIRILYHGAYLPFRGLDEIIESAQYVQNAVFVFRGMGQHEGALRRKVNENGLNDKIVFEDPVSVDMLVQKASECDIGLNPFISVCKNTEYALPNKFFEYMMAGLAIVSSDLAEMRALTQKHEIGVLLKDNTPMSIAETINHLISSKEKLIKFRKNAYKCAKEEFFWEKEERRLFEFYQKFLELA